MTSVTSKEEKEEAGEENVALCAPQQDGASGSSNVETTGRDMTVSELARVSLGLLGMMFAWAMKTLFTTPLFRDVYGVATSKVGYVWVAGPLSGLIVQPVIGVLSDHTSGRGQRSLFLGGGAAVMSLSLLALPTAGEIARWLSGDDSARGTALAVVALWLLDLAFNSSLVAIRAVIADAAPRRQQPQANSAMVLSYGAGTLLGYGVGALDLPALLGASGLVSQTSLCFYVAALFLAITAAISTLQAACLEGSSLHLTAGAHDPVCTSWAEGNGTHAQLPTSPSRTEILVTDLLPEDTGGPELGTGLGSCSHPHGRAAGEGEGVSQAWPLWEGSVGGGDGTGHTAVDAHVREEELGMGLGSCSHRHGRAAGEGEGASQAWPLWEGSVGAGDGNGHTAVDAQVREDGHCGSHSAHGCASDSCRVGDTVGGKGRGSLNRARVKARLLEMAAFWDVPGWLRPVCNVLLFSWVGWYSVNIFGSDWVGVDLFGGDPNAEDGSPTYQAYEDGVAWASAGLAIQAAVITAMGFGPILWMLSWVGLRGTFLLAILVQGGMTLAGAFAGQDNSGGRALALLVLGGLGIPLAVVETLPYMMVGMASQKDQHGQLLGKLNVYIVLAELALTLCVDPITRLATDGDATMLAVGGAVALLAVFVTPGIAASTSQLGRR